MGFPVRIRTRPFRGMLSRKSDAFREGEIVSAPNHFELLLQWQKSMNEKFEKFKATPRYQDFCEEMRGFMTQCAPPTCQHTVFDPNCPECTTAQNRFAEAFKVKWEAVLRQFPELAELRKMPADLWKPEPEGGGLLVPKGMRPEDMPKPIKREPQK